MSHSSHDAARAYEGISILVLGISITAKLCVNWFLPRWTKPSDSLHTQRVHPTKTHKDTILQGDVHRERSVIDAAQHGTAVLDRPMNSQNTLTCSIRLQRSENSCYSCGVRHTTSIISTSIELTEHGAIARKSLFDRGKALFAVHMCSCWHKLAHMSGPPPGHTASLRHW